jgi:hypothetical protein
MTSHQWTLLVWGLLGLAVAGGLTATVLSRGRFPGPGAFLSRITVTRTGRVLVVLGWMWLGWHLFAR